jgi:hypothetical protein
VTADAPLTRRLSPACRRWSGRTIPLEAADVAEVDAVEIILYCPAVSSTPAANWGRYVQGQGLDPAAAYKFTRPPSFPGPMRRLLPKKPIRAIF